MGAFVFILFCLGVLIGVILLIYGLSKPTCATEVNQGDGSESKGESDHER